MALPGPSSPSSPPPSTASRPNTTQDAKIITANDQDQAPPVQADAGSAVKPTRRNLGTTPVIFLILNRMIGTGVFSTPSGVYALTGSVGVSLMFWILGGILALSGLSVYLEFGLRIPRSGGEKNYLERVYRRPRLLTTCVFLVQMVVLGFSSGNSFAFGRYVLFAAGHESPNTYVVRAIGLCCITFAVLLHAFFPRVGVGLIDFLGVFKVAVLLFIVFSGFAALAGHRRVPNPDNFKNAFSRSYDDGFTTGSAYAYATALLRVVYSYKGWENANYVLGEVQDPIRTMRVAAPLAVCGVTVLYVLANVAYFAAVPSDDFAGSEVILAGLYFRNMFGERVGARVLPAFVAASNLGNVLAVSFAQARVNQSFALEGLFPASRFWASEKPCGSPAAGLLLHWIVTVIFLMAPPPGPVYNLLIDLFAYPGAWIGSFVAFGLLWLHYSPTERHRWSSPWRAWLPVIVLFLLSNLFLAFGPFVPPPTTDPDGYPYYVFPVVGIAVIGLGIVYWYCWAYLLPFLFKYRLVTELREGEAEQNTSPFDSVDDDIDPPVRYVPVKLD